MTTDFWVALLRGVNVGGVKVLMAPLRSICEGLGWRDVRSYIASGNLVFRAEGTPDRLAEALESALDAALGRSPRVLVLRADRFREILDAHPFSPDRGNQSHVYFCWRSPVIDTGLLDDFKQPDETLVALGGHVHLHAPNGLGVSRLAERLDRVITGTPTTGRNLNTVRKLAAMLDELDGHAAEVP